MKRLAALLLVISLLTGCGSEKQYQTELHVERLDAHCIVVEGSAIVSKPFESGVYTSEKEWRRAVKECGIKELEEIVGRYDESFFEAYSLACLATCSSGGKSYDFVSAKLVDTDNGTELVISTSYSPMTMVNSLSGYYFLVQLNNDERSSADSISLNEFPRLI